MMGVSLFLFSFETNNPMVKGRSGVIRFGRHPAQGRHRSHQFRELIRVMIIRAIGQVGAIQQNSRFSAVESAEVRFTSTHAKKETTADVKKDSVDLVGFQALTQSSKKLAEKDPAPTPKSIEGAIQTSVKKALDNLPKGGAPSRLK